MGFADRYSSRFKTYPQQIEAEVDGNLTLAVIIPCFNEPNVERTLDSLNSCDRTVGLTEVIVVVNSPEGAPAETVGHHQKTLRQLADWQQRTKPWYTLHIINWPELPKKNAGVGLARKLGMDEALARFNYLNKPEGIIVNLDADCTVSTNYLADLETIFAKNPKATGCNIHFEHPLDQETFGVRHIIHIVQYELYLRVYKAHLAHIDFPYPWHTVGSCFAVRAHIYAKQGGMNSRQAGEDFYFLQKIFPLGNFLELRQATVFPSPRVSDRVPFGTGAMMKKLSAQAENNYLTYSPLAFDDLGVLFAAAPSLYNTNRPEALSHLPGPLSNFVHEGGLPSALKKMNQNSASEAMFLKKFFEWFDAFRIIKYLNRYHEDGTYHKVPLQKAAAKLLNAIRPNDYGNSELELLQLFRQLDKGQTLD